MSPNGDNIVVGTPKRDIVQVYKVFQGNPQIVGANLKGKSGEGFGHSVDMMSWSGRNQFEFTVIGTEAGCVRLYRYINGRYKQFGNDIKGGEGFGHSVSISFDGRYVVVGSPTEDAVSLYFNTNNGIISSGKVSGDQASDKTGYSVSMVGDRNYFAVGSPGANNGAGNVKVYRT